MDSNRYCRADNRRQAAHWSTDMKKIWMLCAVLAFALRTSGQTPSTTYDTGIGHGNPVIPTVQSELPNSLPGVVIESWHYDRQQKTLTLHLVNRSKKDVTAFNISIAERYADGSTDYVDGRPNDIHDHQIMEDMLNLLINAGQGKAFAAGTTHDYVMGEVKDISDVEAVVDVVAYADGTADVLNNERAFRNLMAERKGPLLAMEKVNDVIKRALADPMVSDPVSAALNELLPFAESLDAKTKNGSPEDPEVSEARSLQGDIRSLAQMQQEKMTGTAEREWLTRYVEYQEKRIALLSPHANLPANSVEVR
jgi:hypothetical protein